MKIYHVPVVHSTMDLAVEYINQQGGGPFIIHADQQTNGRGRMGRVWHGAGGNIYASLVMPIAQLAIAPYCGFAMGVCLMNQLKPYLLPGQLFLKWPNDILYNNQKVVGILCQTHQWRGQYYIIIGFGINLAPNEWGGYLPIPTPRDELLSNIGIDYIFWHEKIVAGGFMAIKPQWLADSMPLNHPITTTINGVKQSGFFGGVDDDGGLFFTHPNQIPEKIIVGDIELV